jgi:hypothetical protein
MSAVPGYINGSMRLAVELARIRYDIFRHKVPGTTLLLKGFKSSTLRLELQVQTPPIRHLGGSLWLSLMGVTVPDLYFERVESSLTQEDSAGILSCQTLLRGVGLIRTLSPNSTPTSYISIISRMITRTYRWVRAFSTNEARNEFRGFFLPASKLKPFCDLGVRFQRSIDDVSIEDSGMVKVLRESSSAILEPGMNCKPYAVHDRPGRNVRTESLPRAGNQTVKSRSGSSYVFIQGQALA